VNLPPKDSPVWRRMEDDVADERWPLPYAVWPPSWRPPKPRNATERRRAFDGQWKLRRRLKWFMWFVVAMVPASVWVCLSPPATGSVQRLGLLVVVLEKVCFGFIAAYWTFNAVRYLRGMREFDGSVRRYIEHEGSAT
jgi:hypothetical protein